MSIPVPPLNRESLFAGLSLLIPGVQLTNDGVLIAEGIPLPDGSSIERLEEEEITVVLEKIASAGNKSVTSMQWDRQAEFSLVSLHARADYGKFFEGRQYLSQGENPITYKIGSPSDEFVAYLLCAIGQQPALVRSPRLNFMRRRVSSLMEGRFRNRITERFTGSLLQMVGEVLGVSTLQVEAAKIGADFETLANSFLFHAAYNLDSAARIGVDSLFEPRSIQRFRRGMGATLDAPRQSYNSDLVHHYLMGVAAEIPLLEYLSYYHIAEHYFQKVFNDDLVEQVRKSIIDPSFSVRRAKDVQGVIRVVDKALRQTREEGGFNEPRALELVIEGFVDLSRLIADLDAYDSTLIDYYANNGVPFAGAGKLSLRSQDEDKVRDGLAKRIYKVRNSLVHAKDGDLPKYAPFAHDAELLKEIPLMRFVAEQIVIAHGKAL